MTVSTRPRPRGEADRIERELLGRLGLGNDANTEEIEQAHDHLVEFLESAPHDLHRWATEAIAAADEAYALLSDQSGLDLDSVTEPVAPDPAIRPPRPVSPRPASARPAPRPRGLVEDEDEDLDEDEELPEELEETEGAGMPVRRPLRRTIRRAAPERAAASNRLLRRAVIGVAGIAAALVIVVGVYSVGASSVPGISGTPAPEASASPQIDQAQVTALMQKIAANPNDTASLLSLGNIYFDAGDYATAVTFMQHVVAIDPTNVDALVGLGAAQFNTGDSASAKAQWEKAISIDPNSQEAYFDLGFLYLNQNPPDMTNVVANWNKVVEIDPTSDLAQSVQTHLDAFASQIPATAAPSGSAATPSSSAAPAPGASGN